MAKTSIPAGPGDGKPNAGARSVAGKSSMPDGALIKGPKSEAVRQAQAVVHGARKAIDTQVGQNGNPKKRDASHWGTGAAAKKDADLLK